MNPLNHADFYASDLFCNEILATMRNFEQTTLLVACSLLVSTKLGKIQPGGPALRLLTIVEKSGIQAIA